MFREKLKNDLNGISPDEELLIKVTKMMQEEAQKPREPKRVAFMRLGGMAAAVCMIAVGSIALHNSDGVEASPTVSGSEETKAAAVADTAVPELYVDEAAAEGADNTPAYQAVTEAVAETEWYVLKEETAGTIEAESIGEIITADIYFKGDSVALTEEITLEIAVIAEKYMNENSYRALDLMLTEDETERIGENGLYFKASYMDGSYTAVYINDENSYACKGFLTYDLLGEEKALILSYFE